MKNMQTVGDFLLSLDKEILFAKIVERFNIKKNKKRYLEWLKVCYELAKYPKRNNKILVLEQNIDNNGEVDNYIVPYYVYRRHLNHKLGIKGNNNEDDVGIGIEFIHYDELFGMRMYNYNITRFSDEEVMANILYENTFSGYTDSEKDKYWKQLIKIRNKVIKYAEENAKSI